MPMIVASLFGAASVITGAFGAHALKARVSAGDLAIWQTAVQYHLIHSVVLLALAMFARARPVNIGLPFWLTVLGITIFSGSLYILVLSGQRWLGAVTPIGGLLLIAGWLAIAWRLRG